MREMKDSGIDWVGKIPKDWDTTRIKYLPTGELNSFVDGDWIESPVIIESGIRYYTTGNVGDGVFKYQGDGFISEKTFDTLHCKYAYPGDLVISRLNAPYGRSCIIPNEYDKCVLAVDIVILRTDADKRYLCYVTQCSGYQSAVEDKAAGTTMKRISRTNLGNVKLPFPPINVQCVIAAFLDSKCAEIDDLFADIQSEIETLEAYKRSVITEAVTKGLDKNAPMKDSGISWIGKVPQNWPIYPLKYTFDFVAGATPDSSKADLWDGDVLWITPADYKTKDVYVSGGARNLSDLGFKSCSTHLLPIGTIVVSKRAPIGSAAITTAPLCTNQGCLGLIQKDKLTNGKYYYYVLSIYDEVLNLFGSGTTFKEISASVFGTVKVVNPSVAEQNAIVAYLDSKCAEIDSILAQKQEQLAVLADYKKSIIYEYVTGKKEVPVA